jgi:hypothetical protein
MKVAGDGELKAAMRRGIMWLAEIQAEDGSWCELDPHTERPVLRRSVNKTCDALNGINAGMDLDLAVDLASHIEKGVTWVLEQEKLVRNTTGWGYVDEEAGGHFKPDLVSTCIVLETLVKIEGVSLPLLSVNASWLVTAQYRESGTIEDGKWVKGDTFRITLALAEFLKKIKDSPLFQTSPVE